MILVPGFLKPIAKLCADETSRYSMRGVKFNEYADGQYMATVTDGRLLLIVRGDEATIPPGHGFTVDPVEGEPVFEYVIPAECWEKGFDGNGRTRLPLAIQGITHVDGVAIHLQSGMKKLHSPPVDGRFPDAMQVVPRQVPRARFLVNPRVLAKILTVMADIQDGAGGHQGDRVELLYYGESRPIGLAGGAGSLILDGLFMPLSGGGPTPTPPPPDNKPLSQDVVDAVNEVASETEAHTTNGHSPLPEPSEQTPPHVDRLRGRGRGKKKKDNDA